MKHNKMYMTIFLTLFLTVLPPHLIGQGNLGQSGANFLQIPADAAGAALGGASVANAQGAAGLYWNPAGMVAADGIDVNLSHTNWLVDTRLTYAAGVMPLGENSAIGLSVTTFSMDDMEITTELEPNGTGEYYSAGNLAAGLAYARSLTDRFAFGVTTKMIQENIWNSTSRQLGIDIGSQYQTDFRDLVLAMSVRNIGGKLQFSDDRGEVTWQQATENDPRDERLTPGYRLPQVFQVGISFAALATEQISWRVNFEADVPSDNEERMILANELTFMERFTLRAAYREGFDLGKLSMGAGLHLELSGSNIRLDYAVSLTDAFGALQTIGIGFEL